MNIKEKYQRKRNNFLYFCIAVIIASLNLYGVSASSNTNIIKYESVDTKSMSTAAVAVKKGTEDNNIVSKINEIVNVVDHGSSNTATPQAISLPERQELVQPVSTVPTWRLPVENGVITSWPSYWHVALDITSYRGTNEIIYPVADGVISSIYNDAAGANIVMVNHYIDGVSYTSQYVHMCRYADGIYVGMPVTTDTPLGYMGSTGISTGNHLHISVVDCAYGDESGTCPDLNSFFRRLKIRYNEGFYGLSSIIEVPYSWSSR